MLIDWTVSVSNLLTFFGFMAGGLGFAFVLRGDVKSLAQRMNTVEKNLSTIAGIMELIARQDERLTAQGARIDILQKRVFKIGD